MPIISDTGDAGPAVLAIVRNAAPIAAWDGSTLPFDTVVHDPAGLWNATFHAFDISTPGWYLCQVFAGGVQGISVASIVSTGAASVSVIVNGAGTNITANITQHNEVASGSYVFPPVIGVTHLDAGDSVEVDGTFSTTAGVAALTTFAISLLG